MVSHIYYGDILFFQNILFVGCYEKTPVGNICSDIKNELGSKEECQVAAQHLGLRFANSYDKSGDFPRCLYADDGRNEVYFNLNPNPGRDSVYSTFSAICKCPSGKNSTLTAYCITPNLL